MDAEDFDERSEKTIEPQIFTAIERRIFAAIDAQFCTLPQIMRRMDEESKAYVRDVLKAMIIDRSIVKVDSGVFDAYFRAAKIPSKIWLDGEGKTGAEFCGTPLVPVPRSIAIENGRWNGGNVHAYLFDKEKTKAAGIKRRKPIDYKTLENAVARNLNIADICDRLQINSNTYYNRRKSDAEFAQAIERGAAARNGQQERAKMGGGKTGEPEHDASRLRPEEFSAAKIPSGEMTGKRKKFVEVPGVSDLLDLWAPEMSDDEQNAIWTLCRYLGKKAND